MINKLTLKNKNLNFILILLLTLGVLYFSLKDNFNEVIYHFFNLNWFWLVVGFILVIGYWFFTSLSMYSITKKFTDKISMNEIFKINVVTHFFNGVTPFASGGQPYQIYALKKQKINLVQSTNICVQNFVAYQIALIILGTLAIILNNIFDFFPDVKILKTFVFIGYLVNVLVAFGLFVITFTQKFNKAILKWLIDLGFKFKIVKDKQEKIEKFNSYVSRFHDSTKLLLKDKLNLIKIIFFNLIGLILNYSVPLAILYSMGDFSSFNLYVSIIASAYVMIIGAFVPLPGGTGGLEYSFIAFFGNLVTGSKLTVLMLCWRFITYYFGMIVGGLWFSFSRRNKN
ncbi:MAG: flippase-like domain-containing protein [Firmicutes bacterium]|nr:flippase-like domain-containing protein [Bacillota bacterium]